jgi:hypothetical protein
MVPASKQHEALQFVIDSAFDPESYLLDAETQNKLIDDKNWSWQNNLFQPGRRFDFPISGWVGSIQNGVLTNLMRPSLQARVVEAQFKVDEPFKLSDMYTGLTSAIWTKNAIPTGRTAGMERNTQRIYTQRLINQVTMPFPGTPPDAISLSRLNLTRIKRTASSSLSQSGLDDETNAHLMETIARIDRALDADRLINF